MKGARAAAKVDVRALGRELVRALRGKRSQRAVSKRLGYKVNVLSGWESGRRAPAASEVLRLAEKVGRDLEALGRFDARLSGIGADVPALVRALTDERPHASIARALTDAGTEVSRSTVSRWASGKVAPRFFELLALVAECTHRLVDFVGALVDPASLPSVAEEHARIEAQRLLLSEDPALAAVLPAMTLRAYRALPRHRPGWIAQRVGITPAQEARGIELLVAAGAVVKEKGRYRVVHDRRVDVRHEREVVVRLQQHWAHVAASRAGRVPTDLTRFHLVSVRRADVDALRAMLAQLFERVDARLGEVEDPDRVVLVGVLLQELDAVSRGPRGQGASR